MGIMYTNFDKTNFTFIDTDDGDEYKCIICPSGHTLPVISCEKEKSYNMLSYVQMIEL